MKYTEEEKKQIKALVGRVLDREEESGVIEIAEVDDEGGNPFIKRNTYYITIAKIGSREQRNG